MRDFTWQKKFSYQKNGGKAWPLRTSIAAAPVVLCMVLSCGVFCLFFILFIFIWLKPSSKVQNIGWINVKCKSRAITLLLSVIKLIFKGTQTS